MSDDFARAIGFMRRNICARADRSLRTAHGTAYFSDDLPRVFYYNLLVIDLGARAAADDLIAEADAVQRPAGLAHRQISIDDGLGGVIASGFRQQNWLVEENLVMAHVRAAPSIDLAAFEEVSPEELVLVWSRGMQSDPMVQDEETVRQLVEAQLRRRRAVDVRYFATRADGSIASYCELFSDGQTGQIESVQTLEEFRGRGLGKAVVAGALEASQAVHDFTFIGADANDWPKDLYRSLGFEPIGSTWVFTRPPPSS
jgi:ribosomal protein S18 acetylase RimI-like enzyme